MDIVRHVLSAVFTWQQERNAIWIDNAPKNMPAPIFIDDSHRYGMTRNPAVITALTLVPHRLISVFFS